VNPEMFRRIVALLDRREPFAVATVVAARGSVPGKLGARMIVFADGRQEGTVGGAGLEASVKALAIEAIARRRSGTHHFELARQKPGGLDSVCGGGVEVFVEYMAPRPHLLLCGGGHVGLAIARLCDQLDYAYSVADVRPEFASAERFPSARERLAGEPAALLEHADLSRYSHLLVIGHSHHVDAAIVRGVLARGFDGYLGLIGSENKRLDFRRRCAEAGVPESAFDARVVCPIGLPIEAETPAEIAVAMLAEVIRGYRATTPRVPAA
jgi:xanthine dehydrogenase accessory factor